MAGFGMDESAVHYSSKPHTPDDELGEWTHLRVDATSSGSVVSVIPPKTLNLATTEPKPKRSVSSALVPLALFLMSLPFGFLASVMAVVLYVPVVNLWLNKNYLTVHIAFGATLVFFFVHIFPRVKASILLSVIFTTLFLCSVAYLLAVLSVIVDTPVVFMLNSVCFVVCLQLVVYSTIGLDLTSLFGLVMLFASFTVDYAVVAFVVPSKISDKIIALVSLAGISKGFQMKISEVVEKYQQDEPV